MRVKHRTLIGCLVAAIGLTLIGGPANGGPPARRAAADRATLAAGERAWGQAYITGDVATAEQLLAHDFIGIDTRGNSYDKAGVIADIRALPHGTFDSIDHLVIRLHGNFAVVQAHEHVVGPAAELKPRETVFTDSWVRRGGRWQVVAAEDLDRGLRTPAAYSADEASIRALRAANNRAIAAHDLARFTPMFADDAVFVWSNGTSAVGKAALSRFFSEDFAEPGFIAYIRSPQRVSVSANGARAVEHGTWTALKRSTRYGGDYTAHWAKAGRDWRVRGELYVKLYCAGPLCTP